jgi:clan AA aspartic protease
MGQVKIQVTLRNAREVVMARLGHLAAEHVRTYTTEALIDTGATRLTVPSFVADQLGIIRLGHTAAEYADGRVEEVDTTEGIQIDILGRTVIRDAMILGKQVLIGVTVLEDLDLLVDGKRQRVIPPPDHPDQPIFRV